MTKRTKKQMPTTPSLYPNERRYKYPAPVGEPCVFCGNQHQIETDSIHCAMVHILAHRKQTRFQASIEPFTRSNRDGISLFGSFAPTEIQ